ncbi:hypothetical protein ACQ3I4_16245 [Zafaria sp. Z1313]|uniref:hypothetical protein n=1 Tax=unclassified Zafaria TaxID=2828765 RepID=UPI002E773895|nr:hypothetical protein [Zafaria sp. J156]MEE1622955.1 hypothetical protein [Zafaria sp. J156]
MFITETLNGHPIPPNLMEKLPQGTHSTLKHSAEQSFTDSRIRSHLPGSNIADRAVTGPVPVQDSSLLHHAVAVSEIRDVPVTITGGDRQNAPEGEVNAEDKFLKELADGFALPDVRANSVQADASGLVGSNGK